MRISKSKKIEFLIRDASNKAQTVASSFTIPLNQWTFVASFYDFQARKVYMWNQPDTTPVDTLDFTHGFFANDDPLAIGGWYVNNPSAPSTANFKGRIDDVRISGRIMDIIPGYTSITDNNPRIPVESDLMQNYPNPFNPQTQIEFTLLQSQNISLIVYNSRGQRVITLLQGFLPTGLNQVMFNGENLSSGSYYYQLRGNDFSLTKRMLLVK